MFLSLSRIVFLTTLLCNVYAHRDADEHQEGDWQLDVDQQGRFQVASQVPFEEAVKQPVNNNDNNNNHNNNNNTKPSSTINVQAQSLAAQPEETVTAEPRSYKEDVAYAENHAGLVAGGMLIIFALGSATIMYLLNYNDPQVASYGYKLVFTSSMILSALMIEKTMHAIYMESIIFPIFGENLGIDELFCLVPFVIFFFSVRIVGAVLKTRLDDAFFLQSLLSHLAAFTLIEMVEHPQEHLAQHFEERREDGKFDWAAAVWILGPLVSFGFFKAMRANTQVMSESMSGTADGEIEQPALPESHATLDDASPDAVQSEADDHVEETHAHHSHGVHEHSWREMADEGEIEASAIVFGFMTKMLGIWVVGSQHSADYHTLEEAGHLALWASGWLVLFFLVAAVKATKSPIVSEESWTVPLSHFSMAFAWNIMTACKWVFYWAAFEEEDSILKSFTVRKIVNAVALSPLCLFAIILLDKLGDIGITGDALASDMMSGFALVIGLSWESACGSGVKTFIKQIFTRRHALICQALFVIGLILYIAPAFRRFLLPIARLPVPKRV